MTSTEIANLAIAHLGVGNRIESLDSDDSEEARVCRIFYDVNLEEILRDYHWPFATRIETLAQVEEDPNDEWGFSYRKPANCVRLKRLLSGSRNDNRQSEVKYRIIGDDDGDLILTDIDDAQCEYTVLVSNPNFWPADFCQAVAAKLATLIAPTVCGADPFKRGTYAMGLFNYYVTKAGANAANEERPDEPPPSEFQVARDGELWANQTGGDDSLDSDL